MSKISKIINSGETGVERGALDIALKHSYLVGGWTDNPHLVKKYPGMSESITDKPNQYIEFNVMNADAVIVITIPGIYSPNTEESKILAFRYKKPIFRIQKAEDVANCGKWIESLDEDLVFYVTGPNEKEYINGYKLSSEVLNYLFTFFKYD